MKPLLLFAVLLSSFVANAASSFRTDVLADGSDIYEHHFSILKSSIVTIRIWSPVIGSNHWGEINEEARFGAGLTLYDGDRADDDDNCKVACRFKINGRSFEDTEKSDADLQSKLAKETGSHSFVATQTIIKVGEQTLGDTTISFYENGFKKSAGKWSPGCKPAPVPIPGAFWLFASATIGIFGAKRKATTRSSN